MSHLYNLLDLYAAGSVDVITEVFYYLMQALGIGLFTLYMKKCPTRTRGKNTIVLLIAADAVMISAALLCHAPGPAVFCGATMNLLHGSVAGWYLTLLCVQVPQQRKAAVFSSGYAAGSIGSYLLSLPMNGEMLASVYILPVYIFLMLLTVLLIRFIPDMDKGSDHIMTAGKDRYSKPDYGSVKILFVLIVLLSCCNTLGFYFPMDDVEGSVNWAFTRAFYAVGLVIAGFVTDRDRRYGAVCVIAAMISPFVTIILQSMVSGAAIAVLWTTAYFFFGFFAVFRVISFSDMAERSVDLLPFAAFGLLSGRIGDALGAGIGNMLSGNGIAVLMVTSILAVITICIFFFFYQKQYMHIHCAEDNTAAFFDSYERDHSLTRREGEVLQLVISGKSNPEIAEALFISVNTVKFHMRNILDKTGCSDRNELINMFRKREK